MHDLAMDYSNSCRLCLSKGTSLLPIFRSSVGGVEPLGPKIFSCLSIEVSEYDGLPKQVCHRCECQVNVLHYFRVECEVSQLKLKRWQRTIASSSAREYELECCETGRETLSIKLEPEDDQLHIEHHCLELGSSEVQECGAPMEEADSTNDQCPSQEVLDLNPHVERLDETNTSFNLVISETTSVPVEEDTINITQGDKEDCMLHTNYISQRNNCEVEGSNDVEFIGTFAPRHSIVEVTLENLNESAMYTTLQEKLNYGSSVSSNPMNLDCSQSSEFISSSPCNIQQTLAESNEEQTQNTDQIFKVKEEPMEPFVDSEGPHPSCHVFSPSSISDDSSLFTRSIRKRCAKSVSSDSSSKGSVPNISRYSDSSSAHFHNVELPKINNDMLDENSKYCKICQKSFANLWRHMKNCHAKENPFQCVACSQSFPGRREFVAHRVQTIRKDCRCGKKSVADMSCFVINKKIKSGVKGRYQCIECKAKYGKLNVALIHFRLHSGEKPFFCFKCNKEFRLRTSAARHVAICTAKGDTHPAPSFKKVKIGSSTIKVSQMIKQKAIKPVQSKEKVHKCNKCQKVFNNRIGLSNHQRMECSRRCLSCSKVIQSKSFYKHYRQCIKSESLRKKNESSETCKPVDVKEGNQDPHDDIKDLKKKKEKKVIEEVVHLSAKELFARHIDKDGEIILKCQFCQSIMGSRRTLHRHLLKHTSMAYKCRFCNARMSLHSTYKAHMLKFHKGLNIESEKRLDSVATESSHSFAKETSEMTKPKLQVSFPGFKVSKLKCEICMKLFSSATSLKFHKQTHKKVKCSKCQITFPASMARSHICLPKVKIDEVKCKQSLTVNGVASQQPPSKLPIQYTCLLCKKKFHTRKMLYQHKKMHIKMKIYKCNICDNSYSDAGALLLHKESSHSSELLIQSGGENVMKSEATENSKSLKCSKKSAYKESKEKPWKCGVCHKRFINKQSFRRHTKLCDAPSAIEKPQAPGILHCSLCDKIFESRESFTVHKGWHSRQEHSRPLDTGNSTERLEKAQNEKSEFFEKDALNQSISVGAKEGAALCETFDCDLCERKFSSRKSLRIHITCYHNKPKLSVSQDKKDTPVSCESMKPSLPFKCDVCFLTFSDLSSFTSHSSIHSGNPTDDSSIKTEVLAEVPKQESLQCELCKKEYRSKKSLKYHMLGHSGEKPYKCRSCSNQYSNPKALAKHEKERHTTILRPFCCNKCKTSFILKEDLLAHHVKCTH